MESRKESDIKEDESIRDAEKHDPQDTLHQRLQQHKIKKRILLAEKQKQEMNAMINKSTITPEFKVDHTNTPYRWIEKRNFEKGKHSKKRPISVREKLKPFPFEKRDRSLYFNQDDNEVDSFFVNMEKLEDVSPGSQIVSRNTLKLDQSDFPLERFDASELDTKTPEEWFQQCKRGVAPFYENGECIWRPCNILEYNSNEQKFAIQFDGSTKQKYVRRINLRFDHEDPEKFRKRIVEAESKRELAKAQLRFDHFIENQSNHEPRAMSKVVLEGIHSKVVDGLPSGMIIAEGETLADLLKSLTDVVIREYVRSIKKAIVWHKLQHDVPFREEYVAMRMIPIPEKAIPQQYGKVPIPQNFFLQNQKKIKENYFTSNSTWLIILRHIYSLWEDQIVHIRYADSTMSDLQLPCRLSHFHELQKKHYKEVTSTIKTNWRKAIAEHFTDSMQDMYNFFQSDREEFESSSLRKILKNIELRMSFQLRHICKNSILNWIKFIEKKTKGSNGNGFFDVQLCLKEGSVTITPSLEEIQTALLDPLDAMVRVVRKFTSIDKSMMPLLNLPDTILLNVEAGDPTLADIDQSLKDTREKLNFLLAEAMKAPHELARLYEKNAYLMNIDKQEYVNAFCSKNPTLPEYCVEIQKFHSLISQVETISSSQEHFNLVCVDTTSIKEQLICQAKEIKHLFIQAIVKDANFQNVQITKSFEDILAKINEKPTNESELAKLKAFIHESKVTVALLMERVSEIHSRFDALVEFEYRVSEEDFRLCWSTKQWPLRVQSAADACASALEEDKIIMMEKLVLEKEKFELDLNRYESEVLAFKSYEDITQTERYVEMAITLNESLMEAKAKANDFNVREDVFGFPPTEYTLLEKLENDFSSYYKLWTMCSEFNHSKETWLLGSFLELNGMEIEQKVTEWWKSSYKLTKTLAEESPGSAEIARVLREKTDEFRTYLPVIQSLASKALQDRHWETLSQKMGETIERDEELSLKQLIENGILNHLETIQEVCTIAEKEYSLEKALDAMLTEWETVELKCLPYRESGTYILHSLDDIVALLDDHVVKTQTMRNSPYIKPIESKCKSWEKKLQYIIQLLEEWMMCQRTWLYLSPIFSSEDIMRQMPTETRRFATVDALWRKTMEDTKGDSNFLTVIAMDKLLQKFQKANAKLDEIQKGLNDYLEMKRLYFPRFFFLSNDELLEILSQTKEPRAVQPHLGKCFEGIASVTFSETLLITEMISAQGEKVSLNKKVNPESGRNRGNVEYWLLELENSQWESIRSHIKHGIQDYLQCKREEWVLKWPAQVVLSVSQVFWTQGVSESLRNSEKQKNSLEHYLKILNQQLDEIVYLVRGERTKMERTTIGALVVIDVHARDTVLHMIQSKVQNEQDFDWISQLRYYWNQQIKTTTTTTTTTNSKNQEEYDLEARIVNAKVNYGYEYLGNTMRLVITPLTDRCYRTMMGAIYLLYGGAPEGPAGTGKTETVKDLSKAIAIQCVVFNCSDGLDYLAMAKFFKGLAGCGSWCCFDEFNRINIEVLSVIAQQILTINEGKKAGVDKFHFEGTFMKLNPSANVFITMNPGYVGRAELPDNLKSLFRPCAMMVPDYALIAEIRLYSFGFREARSNARKLTQVLQLSSEQLSSQKHYDYGMRAVNSILVAAGNLRQLLGNDPTWTEDKIVLRSVEDVNLPKFTTDDLPLFQGITSDLFPETKLPSPDHGDLLPMIHQICQEGICIVPEQIVHLEPKPEFIQKVIQLYETVLVRHGLMVVGQTGSGKTCVIHTLAAAMTQCCVESQGNKVFSKVQVFTMNPKSITSGQLYGNFDENTHEWSDGILACTYRNCARDSTSDRMWITFDGPVDAVWIENMNTVLDDNKKLCLMSGEIIKMTDQMTMMFETEDLEEASPATVSRVGMVFLELKNMGWQPLLNCWLTNKFYTNNQTIKLNNKFNNKQQEETQQQQPQEETQQQQQQQPQEKTQQQQQPNNQTTKQQEQEQEQEQQEQQEQQEGIYIRELMEWLVPPLLYFVEKQCVVPTPVTFVELVASLLRLFSCLLEQSNNRTDPITNSTNFKRIQNSYGENNNKNSMPTNPGNNVPVGESQQFDETKSPKHNNIIKSLRNALRGEEFSMYVNKTLEGCLIMAIIWSIGACINAQGRLALNNYLRAFMEGEDMESTNNSLFQEFLCKHPKYQYEPRKALSKIPLEGTVYDYKYDVTRGIWVDWMQGGEFYTIPSNSQFTSILVPTMDTERNSWLLDLLISHQCHVLCTGDTGTGKSVSIKQKLLKGMNDQYTSIFMNFSAQTSANQVQDLIDSKLDKRRKGVLGPPVGYKCVVFVDDLNMPAKEIYGAQPPIELLRQWMDHGGWYNRKENTFTQLVDLQFIGAMGPPGGGRTRITQRYVRHFNLLNFVPFDTNSLQRIFSCIVEWFLKGFSQPVKQIGSLMVTATIDIYNSISSNLLPTPTKSHYTFNLRDLSKVFQGIAQGDPELIQDAASLIRLWSHESFRVFSDRLVDKKDRDWFYKEICTKVMEYFKMDYSSFFQKDQYFIYGKFNEGKYAKKTYQEIVDRKHLQRIMNSYLDDYNCVSSAPMHLVLFQNAIEHIARISRVINQPYGNALLVGVGGSGRKSLTTLAVFIAEFKLFQIEITKAYGHLEWREDIKKVLRLAGESNTPTVFLFSDTQIVHETFLEDLNGILNTGEVANLWNNEELVYLSESMEKQASSSGLHFSNTIELYDYFVQRCRENLHVVLALSPIGDAFRTRLRMFPSLVNCCTIDWFSEWPEEALRSVAQNFLEEIALPESIKQGVVDVCVNMQEKVSKMSQMYYRSIRRHYYVTPTSYLELIGTFKGLLSKRRLEVMQMKERYDNGLTKLVDTADQVEKMQVELEALQPKLKIATIETDALLETIAREQKEANLTKSIVEKEEKLCNEQAAHANEIKSSCEAELGEAIPALESAVKALKTLTKADITEVKAMKKPPDGVKLTMEAICLMLGVAALKMKDPQGGVKKVDDYWVPAQKLLNDPKFINKLMEYDKDNINPEIMAVVAPFVQKQEFQPEKVKKASLAAAGLCHWVHAMVIYDRVAKVVAPKREALKQATADLEDAQSLLKTKQEALQEILDKVAKLQNDLEEANQKMSHLQHQVDDCSTKLKRAEQLIGGLGGERTRWFEMSSTLQLVYDNVVGDIMLASGVIAYLGAFVSSYREEAVLQWSDLLRNKNIPCSSKFQLIETLGESVKIRAWTMAKLPNDSFSIDNAIMLFQSNRWPLMIDPQGQANRWVRNMEGNNNLKIIKQTQATFIRSVENALQFGTPVLIENISEEVDPILESVLLKQIHLVGGVKTIRLGDNVVEYDEKFRLYLTTKLRNPHYPPETCVKVNLLNFMATSEGLQDQMLGLVVAKEEPGLETQREKLVLEDQENKQKLKDIEDKILHLLQTVEGNILDDEVLIETLAASKITSNKIEVKVREAAITQKMIAEKRQGYTPVAVRSSQLFFCISDLALIDPMYQYALDWYINLFLFSIERAETSKDFNTRLDHLNETFTYTLYVNVCRSLFEKDKLLFSFLLAVKILIGNGEVELEHLRYFLAGNTLLEFSKPKPMNNGWLSDQCWANILGLDELDGFNASCTGTHTFSDEFSKRIQEWEKCFNSSNPEEQVKTIPQVAGLDQFKKLIVLRCLRPDIVISAIMTFVSDKIGKKYIEPQPFDLMAGYNDSNCTTPLIFVLTPGADPMSELLKLAQELNCSKKLVAISLGQGQGPLAENAIAEAIDNGTWVCLQNCHLSVSWLPNLERICEDITPERVHANFRLWLTSEPTSQFPPFILQNGVKMTNEPPRGIKANLKGTYLTLDENWFESSTRKNEFKKLLFGLCFFHAIVRERTKYGPLGWNIKYVFSGSDLNISKDQLKIFLDALGPHDPIPYTALAYLAGECNYGGRVTDDKDRRCIVNILSDFYTPQILQDKYHFSPSGIYYSPPPGSLLSYMEYINNLPLKEGPEIFGLHENANISFALAETNSLLEAALSLQPRSEGADGKSWDSTLEEVATDIGSRIPPPFDVEKAEIEFPVVYNESMNTVLTQELIRFNRLINVVTKSLSEIRRALKGLVVMSAELEALGNSLVNGQVPAIWQAVAYPSLKPLASWVNDLLARLHFLQEWIDQRTAPPVFWISGFFFTQAFITGTLQNYARKHAVPIDQVDFDTLMLNRSQMKDLNRKAEDGAYITGLYMDGAKWDYDKMTIQDSKHRELHVAMPTILLLPKPRSEIELVHDVHPNGTAHVFLCPVYKTSLRQGTLSTTGHSTNFVMTVRIPMVQQHNQKYWIKRGVALLTQLDT